jgi:hypothetical protein
MSKLTQPTRFAAFLDAYAEQLSRLASELTQLHQDLSELRDDMRGVLPQPTELEAAA